MKPELPGNETSPVFEAERLVKRYGTSTAVRVDHFRVSRGEILGLLGHNGAGKSSLIKMLVGISSPDDGAVRFCGAPVTGTMEARSLIAYMPQSGFALNTLTFSEALLVAGRLRGLDRRQRLNEKDRVLDLLDVRSLEGKIANRMSGGERRLLQIAVTLVGQLPVMVLDEPTNDLDPARRADVWSLIAQLGEQGSTIILVTHSPLEVEHVVDRVAIMRGGTIVASGSPMALRASIGNRLKGEFPRQTLSETLPPYVRVEKSTERRLVVSFPAEKVDDFLKLHDLRSIESFSLSTPSLEDIFLEYPR